ncbi:MAG: potassium channel protein [Syntrophobacteraceae bacterium]|nr:potassium channel protein [Desulfobacteraceae bacterium]
MADSSLSRVLIAQMGLAKELLERLIMPLLLVVSTFVFGTAGFALIGNGKWTLFDCAYMTSITLTTVGYGEVLDQMGQDARTFAMVVMWVGMGVTLYAVSTITAFVVEQDLRRILKERRMERQIAALRGHIIVCGVGKTGYNVVTELYTTRHPCVLIDENKERLLRAQQSFKDLFFLCGDATEEEILKRAGIENADGIIAALNDDGHNLLITVQARYVNPNIKIVARCDQGNLADKFYRAGANYIVNPALIGGMRMASEMIRPNVVSFLDRMLRGHDKSVRVEEITISERSHWAGRSLSEIGFHKHTGLWVIALKRREDEEFTYNPAPGERLEAGTVIITIGNPAQISRVKQHCSPS